MATKTKHRTNYPLPSAFEDLVANMPPMAIRDELHHANVVEMIDRLMQIAKLSRGQADYLETLVELVEVYEAKHHAIELDGMSGVQLLGYVLGQADWSGSDLARFLGIHPSMGSKILTGERILTWEHAKKLAAHFKMDPAAFMD
jgi:antitoxin component HigA of HigAB toxin-antitoxin module